MTSVRLLATTTALTVLAGLGVTLPTSPALAEGAPPSTGMATQAYLDGTSGVPNPMGSGVWSDMTGGAAARPYVRSLSVTNDGVTTPVITDAGVTPPAVAPGGLTAVVSPLNLCRAGQAPSPGSCYATPNRVAVTLVRSAGDTNTWDFSRDTTSASPRVDADTVVEMTVALNTLGRSLRWSWANGDLISWRPSRLGQDDATVTIKFRPATMPLVTNFPAGNGCTATPVRDCNIDSADAEVRTAALLLSLDETLSPALTGAVFATQNAFSGFLEPTGTAAAPVLDLQVGSTHRRSDGSPQLGVLQAALPAAALLQLYGIPAADAARAFTTTRAGDPGSNTAPTYTTWTAAENGMDGLLVTVRDITFSVPSYRVRSRIAHATTTAAARPAGTQVTVGRTGCSASRKCLATVVDLGRASRTAYAGKARTVVTRIAVRSATATLTMPPRTLVRGHSYAVVLRAARSGRLVSTGRGTVS